MLQSLPFKEQVRQRSELLRLLVTVAFRADARAAAGSLGFDILRAVTAPLYGLWLKFLVDGATAQDERLITIAAIGLGLTAGVPWLAGGIGTRMRMRLEEGVGHELERRLALTVAGTPRLEQFEQPRFLDLLQLIRAEQGALGRAVGSLVIVAGALIQAITVTVLLSTVHPLLVLLPLAGIPTYLAERSWQNRLGTSEEEAAPQDRLARHIEDLISNPSTAKEVRTSRLGSVLAERHGAALSMARKTRSRAQIHGAITASSSWAMFALVFAAAVAFVVWQVTQGLASTGDVVFAISLAGTARISVGNVIRTMARMSRQFRVAQRFRELESLVAPDNQSVDFAPPPQRITTSLQLHEVSFSYPGTEIGVLLNLNLTMPAGSIIALVGENGAGKSTFVKLLCGFYEPTAGDIRVDGISILGTDPAEWRSNIAATFQDFVRFELTVGDSVGLGDLPHRADTESIWSAVDAAGADVTVHALPEHLGTQLGRSWPDGHDLSTGQWQRIALARGLMRREPLLLILDEPTSSLDAETEHALFERMISIASDRQKRGLVTVLITHRFSTVRMVDFIVVLSQGRIVEQGTHDELIHNAGTYAELYSMQARSYA